MIRAQAPAKVNLTLEVLGRRPNGYHDIRSLTVFAAFGDQLEITPADTLSLTLEGPFADAAGAGDGNLVLKAARLLQGECATGRGARIHLSKEIPVGAGLGGGSADAAAVLLALNELWGCGLSFDDLCAMAPMLGADVAMCLIGQPLMAEGIGERITLLPEGIPTLYAVLAHPRVPLLTADVYRALVVKPPGHEIRLPPTPMTVEALIAALAQSTNGLEAAACSVSPHVAQVLAALEALRPKPLLVRMTGSGACCFALYATASESDKAASALQAAQPGWWVRATRLAA